MRIEKGYSVLWIISGVLLFIWWPLYGILLPKYGSEFTEMASSSYWVLVNLIAVIGLVFLIFASIDMFYSFRSISSYLSFIGLVSLTIGNVLFLCEEIIQTFIFPILAKSNTNILLLDGVYFTSGYVKINAFIWGILSTIGFFIMCYLIIKNSVVQRWIVVGIVIGSVLFYITPFFFGIFGSTILRTIGLMMLGTMFVSLGIYHIKAKDVQKNRLNEHH